MKKLTILLVLAAGCATVPSPGGHETIACQRYVDDRAPGYTVYVCPRPFPSKRSALNDSGLGCANSTHEASGAKGPYTPCGWTVGYTDKVAKEIFVYDVFLPENLEHELLHAQGKIGDDQ